MKKLNNRGLSHHMILILVAVVAVIGAAGYFVWNRQNNIDAKAAKYTNLSNISYGGKGAGIAPKITFTGCKTMVDQNKGLYQITLFAKKEDRKADAKVSAGYYRDTRNEFNQIGAWSKGGSVSITKHIIQMTDRTFYSAKSTVESSENSWFYEMGYYPDLLVNC